MKAIVRFEYGPPDVLQLQDVDKPVVKDDGVLVRVRAAGVNMADVDYLRGRPPVARLITGLRRPRNRGLGLDVAGQVEAVGKSVTRFQLGDEVFGDLTEHGFGAFAEYACAPVDAFALKPASIAFEEAATVPPGGRHGPPGSSQQRPNRARAERTRSTVRAETSVPSPCRSRSRSVLK